MVKDALKDAEKRMKVSLDHFRKELSKLRTGRASLGLFEDVKVDYYGSLTPVNQMASIKIPDPTLVVVQPFDPSLIEALDKAIRGADLGLNPLNDGKVLKVPIPPLDEDRRREMAKRIGKMLEEEKAALRVMRRESKELIEDMEKEKLITEDDKFKGLEHLQKITDEHVKKIEELASVKEKEILQV
ncbi:MAG: ribosome recycling factor [Candidatus Aminicenantes bacterium RBG_13_62_12]|nr:MAG: ribosome recycling factor [Candidatus Aminicenantes bacterium RBG_13_62_12]